jgi:A/G-specific adenine glycosylase
MLQQTQVVTVVPYFEKFLARFPSVEDLAQASEGDVMLHWAGLGYYSRARNLHRAAQEIVGAGRFPGDRAGWEALPGVGPYTAGAILSITRDAPEAILDGNVERVLSRLFRVSRGRGDAAYKARLWRLARTFVKRGVRAGVRPSVLNQALMELGATVCTPKSPKCPLCPVSAVCRGLRRGDAAAYPPAKRPKEWLEVREKMHCWLDPRGRVLLRKREAGEWRAGLWDLMDEAPARAGRKLLGRIETRYVVTRHRVRRETQVWRVKTALRAAEPGSSDCQWVNAQNPNVAVGSALKSTLKQALDQYSSDHPS